jgi:hypothetical protein
MMSGNLWMILGAVIIALGLLSGTLMIQHGNNIKEKKSQKLINTNMKVSEKNLVSKIDDSNKDILKQTRVSEEKIQGQLQDSEKKILKEISTKNEHSNPKRSKFTKKTLKQRKSELYDSIFLLDSAIQGIARGESQHMKIISSQLRALVCSDSKSSEPLLINLAEEMGFNLKCYGFTTNAKDDGAVFAFNPGPKISLAPFMGGREINFKEWIEAPILVFGEYSYNANELIILVTETDGGIKYSEEMSEKLQNIKGIIYHKNGSEFSEVDNILIQIAQYVIHHGRIIINS